MSAEGWGDRFGRRRFAARTLARARAEPLEPYCLYDSPPISALRLLKFRILMQHIFQELDRAALIRAVGRLGGADDESQDNISKRHDMDGVFKMNTAFLLMAQYNGKAIIPIDDVCRDYFSHLTPTKLVRKISAGEIAIPLVRIEPSQKCAKGVHLSDLAKYLDARAEAARKEMVGLTG